MRLIKYDNNFFTDPWSDLDRWFGRALNAPAFPGFFDDVPTREFPLDIYEDDDNRYVRAELPGFGKDDINVELENAVLTVTAEHKEGEKEENRQTVSRSITVGDDIDADKVKAKTENGILFVTLPKTEERKPRLISVS